MSKYDELIIKLKEKRNRKLGRDNVAKKNLTVLKKELVEYMGTKYGNVEVDEPEFNSSMFKSCIKINFNFIDGSSSDGKEISEIFTLPIEGEYLNDENIIYEGNFYKFNKDDMKKFLDVLYKKIEKYFT